MDIKVDYIVDAKGLSCPMPIVKTKKKMSGIEPGSVVEVVATDRGSKADIAAWSKSSGEQYLGTVEQEGLMRHFIRKSKPTEVKEPITSERIVHLEQLQEKLNNEAIVLIDVREPAEFAMEHIPNSLSIPLGEIEERAAELDLDDDIYLICRTGNRSDFATKILAKKGFKKVTNVVPGITSWNGPTNTLHGGDE
ncbi:MAG TPA: rhodanese-like domain-containing protein [Virgibacillus sp.]|nr:rhodanese-like domain-containing protein [Virgibacillus sp.]